MDKPSSFLIQPQENSAVGSTVFTRVPMGKEFSCHYRKCKRHGFDPGLGRYPERGNGNPLQYSCLENLMDRGAWRATVHGSQRVGYDWCDLAAAAATALKPPLPSALVFSLKYVWSPFIPALPHFFTTKQHFGDHLTNCLLLKAFFQDLRLMKLKLIQPLKVFMFCFKKGHSLVKCKNVTAILQYLKVVILL